MCFPTCSKTNCGLDTQIGSSSFQDVPTWHVVHASFFFKLLMSMQTCAAVCMILTPVVNLISHHHRAVRFLNLMCPRRFLKTMRLLLLHPFLLQRFCKSSGQQRGVLRSLEQRLCMRACRACTSRAHSVTVRAVDVAYLVVVAVRQHAAICAELFGINAAHSLSATVTRQAPQKPLQQDVGTMCLVLPLA